ncbi:adenosylcobalamin-dependent ribonucleoside-diphosphate reductase [Dehalogenimonas etheniformans]|uniref:Vitamin B12-dependent ribonucleotide reductase n=1 Tax=Dehalogenimonas etheniformans TaxID=1536648 RepID=A0A2P5P6X8_9CHLR|nr:adenosylcobalamin-dependent ribonucleoside-diphosphate reductase [Dehalogenimonas etheniformans]PPD58061.1 adenosylcobalamin-dependent ribonucleoside-diphosphate reductase [Dehalogenimonas etheniformans]QNT75411.1 adenosylcobalamin-dependent ribonucleoside-diphosphate reductase [Dehalogenimonas etheniformans]
MTKVQNSKNPSPQACDRIELTPNARRVLEKRYLRKDSGGRVIETPEGLFQRVAKALAAAELNYDPTADINAKEQEFFGVMSHLEFLPNSPTLLNAGKKNGQLAACFALPLEDSIEGIFDAMKYTAIIHKSGGGTGFSFSRLRPAGDKVGGETGIAGGPVNFLNALSIASDVIRQGGVRRGCSIGLLSVHHPDILKFIAAKDNPMALTNFCISVAITDAFMEALSKGTDYDLINPRTGKVTGHLNAVEVFKEIVAQSWKTGDPGLVFIDRVNRGNPTPNLGPIETVTGCAEQALLPYESCNLGSINLAKMVKPDGSKSVVDYDKLGTVIKTAINLLDNVIDVNHYPLPQIEEVTKKTRKIGLGVMGFADMLVLLGIPYDSGEAVKMAEYVMAFITDTAHDASEELAKKRGVFPAWKGSKWDAPGGRPQRHASCTTVAPTGTISLIAGCNVGIEPFYATVFVRNVLDGENLLEINPYFEAAARHQGFYSGDLLQELVTCADLQGVESVPETVKRVFATSNRISPEAHVRIQAAFQRHTDGAVSKMTNVPNTTTPQKQADIFLFGYREGVKGITLYRDASRELESLCADEKAHKLVTEYIKANP